MVIKITKRLNNIWLGSASFIFLGAVGMSIYNAINGFIIPSIIYASSGFLFWKINYHIRKTFLDFEVIGEEPQPMTIEIIDNSKLYKKEDFKIGLKKAKVSGAVKTGSKSK